MITHGSKYLPLLMLHPLLEVRASAARELNPAFLVYCKGTTVIFIAINMEHIDTYPALLISESISRQNIRHMAKKMRMHGLLFRPHFKTHQSLNTARWFKDEGITAITVSSVKMARMFAAAGWEDITIAFPLNVHETEAINSLAQSVNLNVVMDMPQQAAVLSATIKQRMGFFIKTDTGYGRAGIKAGETEKMDAILGIAQHPLLVFKGFLTHAGETYHAHSVEEILEIHKRSSALLAGLKQRYFSRFPGILASAGDTPTASLASDFTGLDELRPGNFVYYDLMQLRLGSCRFEHIAAAVVCPVISVYPKRNEALLQCGAVHLSKEFLLDNDGTLNFGLVVPFKEGKWLSPEGKDHLSRLSQEHGIFSTQSMWAQQLKPGDMVAVIPVHSCLTVDLMRK